MANEIGHRHSSTAVIALLALIVGCGGGGADPSTGPGGTGSSSSAATTTGAGAGGSGTTGGSGGGSVGSGGQGSTTSATGTTGGSGGSGAGGSGAGTGGAGAGGGVGGGGLPTLGTLVVLGDSISDGGGKSPFYYDLLKTDLKAKYGNIAYHNNAKSGSKTGNLVSQINGLPGALPGPVAVTITSGGNDMKAALVQVITGTDAAAKAQMGNNIDAALDALLQPNRFGPGVQVFVYEGNIYDASDGVGDYGSNGCAFGQGLPAIATDAFFNAWNSVILDQVTAHGQVSADMHGYFYGHGYASNPNWYAADCTHPSQIGHDQLHKFFYEKITGIALP